VIRAKKKKNGHFAERPTIKARRPASDMILFPFHALWNGTQFHRDVARFNPRYTRIADDMEALAPPEILDEYLGQTLALTLAGKTQWRPVAERLFG
jgi:hypothetical protein